MSLRALLVQNRDFRRLFLASVVSLTGDWFSFVAVADLVSRLTGRPGAAAFVYAATVLPVFLASPIAGAVADRFDRKRILVISDLVRVPLALLLCLAALWGSVVIAITAVIALGIASSFHDPVTSAATPNLVAEEDLARAQSLMGAVWGSMLLVGAGIGGVVAELFGIQAAFMIDAASFALSAWLVSGIERPMQQRAPAPRPAGQLREALRYIRGDRLVARLVLAKVGVSSANGTVGLLPAFAHGTFAGTNIATGLLFAARGLGAMLGPILARALAGATPGPRAIILVCGASTLLYVGVYAALPLTPWFALAMLLVAIAHLGGGAQWAMSTYGLQVATPDHLRGRVLSLDYGLATLAIGVSALVAGGLADAYGEASATWWLAGAGAMYGVGWLVWALSGARRPPA
ncbi:MAG: major facilitator superfamily 1 [Myxococcales bacterium]|nr:major facilitator superfamily 1 [Myxococcales bacterium]